VNIGSSISSLIVSLCQTFCGGSKGFRGLAAELSKEHSASNRVPAGNRTGFPRF